MKTVSHFRNILLFLLLILPSIACDLSVAPSQTEPPQRPQELTLTSSPQTKPPAATATPTATEEPTREPSLEPTQEQIIIEVVPPTNTPRVVAALPRSVLGAPSEGGGTCGPQPDYPFDCAVVLTDASFVQFFIYQDGRELTAQDGVQQVDFYVYNSDKSRTFYSHTEQNSPYCIFGGESACTPWVFEGGVYKWSSGGEAVQNGTYIISIDSFVGSGEPTNIHWEYFVDVFLSN
jgi:hypothetical protein